MTSTTKGYYFKENIDFQLREAIEKGLKELGIQSLSNSLKKVLTNPEVIELIKLLQKNG